MMTDPPSNSTESTSSSTTGMTTDVGSNTSTGETNDGHGVIIPRLPLPLKMKRSFFIQLYKSFNSLVFYT